MKFWENVKSEIKRQNTTQEWVSLRTGIKYETLRGWVYKGILPRADKAVAIAKVLNTSVEFLIDGPQSKNRSPRKTELINFIDSLSEEQIKKASEILKTVFE